MHLEGENQLINTMFQTITAFKIKLKLRQSQIKGNNLIDSDKFLNMVLSTMKNM